MHMLSQKRHDPARHAEDKQNNETRGTKHKDGTGHSGRKKKRENKSAEDEDSWNGNMLKTL